MIRKALKLALLGSIAALMFQATAHAQVVLTVGSGSAVTTVQGSATFENASSLFSRPYLEGGMSFNSVGLSLNNNGCGFSGCSGAFPFSGTNYLYGVGSAGDACDIMSGTTCDIDLP